ncbi:hypothetical protein FRB91_006260 [Serendipita sp. 411]|nr:hypothetical protein FRB91_006260 [Serendipita sp. 411]
METTPLTLQATSSSLLMPPKTISINVTTHTRHISSKFMLRIVAISVAVLVTSLGVGFAFLFYLLQSTVEWTANELVTAVPQGNVLLITTMISKVFLTLVPVVVGISSYWVANGWIRTTKAVRYNITDRDLPTPYQYSLLLQIFKGASVFSLWTTIQYLVKSTSTSRNRTSRQLLQAFTVLCITLFLTYGLVGTDFVLHSLSTTRPVSIRGESLDPSSITNLNGRRFKDECNDVSTNTSACTIGDVDLEEAYLILANMSSSSQISFSYPIAPNGYAQSIALLTDAKPPSNVAFTASTIGISTKCDVLTQGCDPEKQCNEYGDFHPPATHLRASYPCSVMVGIACTVNNWPRYWMTDYYEQAMMKISETLENRNETEVVEIQFQPVDPSTGHNPFRIFTHLSSYIDSKNAEENCGERSVSGACIRDKDGGYIYLMDDDYTSPTHHYRLSLIGCTVSVFEIEYSYLNGTYNANISTARMAGNATTRAISRTLYTEEQLRTIISNPAIGLASSGGNSSAVASLIEEKLSLLMLSMSHSVFETTPLSSLASQEHVLATVLPTSVMTTFFVFIIGFVVFVVFLTALALASSREAVYIGGTGQAGSKGRPKLVNSVEMASQRLREPTGVIYKVFEEEMDDQQRWAKEGIEMFVEGQDTRRRQARDVVVGLKEDGSFGFQ